MKIMFSIFLFINTLGHKDCCSSLHSFPYPCLSFHSCCILLAIRNFAEVGIAEAVVEVGIVGVGFVEV
jgi:hypothetical protein